MMKTILKNTLYLFYIFVKIAKILQMIDIFIKSLNLMQNCNKSHEIL